MLASTQEVAEALGVSTATVMRYLRRGIIPQECATKLGSGRSARWRFNLEAIERELLGRYSKPPEYPQ